MNALIAQFAEQAKNSVPAGLDTVAWIAKYNEIFAELIVQECIRECEYARDSDALNAAGAIKELFWS